MKNNEKAYIYPLMPERRSLSIRDFNFRHTGGKWRVTYTSPTTFKSWTATIYPSLIDEILDKTKKTKRSDLELLKRLCKQGA